MSIKTTQVAPFQEFVDFSSLPWSYSLVRSSLIWSIMDYAIPRESTDSSGSQPSQYKSRFYEHMSQAYTAPPEDWPLRAASPPVLAASKNHKHSPSMESFASARSTSSSTSTSSFRRLKSAFRLKTASLFQPSPTSHPDSVYTIKGSTRTFKKEDIKLGGLTESSNLLHYI